MKFLDLLRMSSGNLWKRKVRTILTVLGVVIGVASMMEQYESYGSLTQIEVYSWSSETGEDMHLDDALIGELEGLEHVESVWPSLQMSVLAKYGGYEGYLQLYTMPKEAFAEMRIDVGEGRLPGQDKELTFFYGNQVLQNFYNAKGSSGQVWEAPDIDLMRDPIFIIFDTSAYYAAGTTDENGQTQPMPKKYLIPACGVEASNEEVWSQYGWQTQCDIDQLIPELKKIFKNKVIPGQPTTKSGKPYKEIFYNTLYVNVDDMSHVAEVQTYLTNLGYQTYSQAERGVPLCGCHRHHQHDDDVHLRADEGDRRHEGARLRPAQYQNAVPDGGGLYRPDRRLYRPDPQLYHIGRYQQGGTGGAGRTGVCGQHLLYSFLAGDPCPCLRGPRRHDSGLLPGEKSHALKSACRDPQRVSDERPDA